MTSHRRGKHVPQRTCVACRETADKRALIRIVRSQEGVAVDPSGKAAGRGAYVHNRPECWDSALRGPLERSLRTSFGDDERAGLRKALEELTDQPRA